MRLTITGPEGGRPAAPVAARVPLERIDDERMMGLVDVDSGQAFPVQVDSRGRLCWHQEEMAEGEVRTYRLDPAGFLADVDRVVVRERRGNTADILQAGKLIARYNGSPDLPRPFISPILSPVGLEVTMDAGAGETLYGQSPHHHSCWAGWSDVSGVDHWTDGPNAGRQRHKRFTLSTSGPVFGRFSVLIAWLAPDGRQQFHEQRVFTIYAKRTGNRIIDIINRFVMSDGPVEFGDTCHGGMCALQVAPPLTPAGGGLLRNSSGGTGEAECWGAAARWCDVTGMIDGRAVGITVFDCPSNPRHPTLWNARDNGLLAANPFGLGSFLNQPEARRPKVLDADSVFMLRYRLVIHDSSPTPEQINCLCDSFSRPLDIVVE